MSSNKQDDKKEMIKISKVDFIKALVATYTKTKNISIDENNIAIVNTSGIKPDLLNKKILLSFMGVGKPLLNQHLIEEIFIAENAISASTGHQIFSYAISTIFPNNNVNHLFDFINSNSMPVKLHMSLHSPFSEERQKLLPFTSVSVEKAMELLLEYRQKASTNEKIMHNLPQFHKYTEPIEIHYTLIENVNDSKKHLFKMTELLKKYCIPIKFITFNPINSLKRSPLTNEWINYLQCELPHLHISAYTPPGSEVGSSCGEFTKHFYHQEIETPEELLEFEEWKNKHMVVNQEGIPI